MSDKKLYGYIKIREKDGIKTIVLRPKDEIKDYCIKHNRKQQYDYLEIDSHDPDEVLEKYKLEELDKYFMVLPNDPHEFYNVIYKRLDKER